MYVIELVSPIEIDKAVDIAFDLAFRTQQDVRRVLSRLLKGGKLAQASSSEGSQKLKAVFEAYGLKVRVLEPEPQELPVKPIAISKAVSAEAKKQAKQEAASKPAFSLREHRIYLILSLLSSLFLLYLLHTSPRS